MVSTERVAVILTQTRPQALVLRADGLEALPGFAPATKFRS
jgi:hypothetical protein